MNRRFEIEQEARPAGSDAYKVRGEMKERKTDEMEERNG